ncbi:NADH-quinone oxidoreductase subunit C [Celeribacter neptunius]|uniref:NADH dehydrogenase subunit C n=1 Tax=Celeribacter neptunius TaxID=588602 RepID=A0A1I3N9L3_9RHOB|nr:NADH-quinone oxidoreductase subunit C [Celeribacter neptunius]SFJ05815.1 NADH dehydrogenase subunit C [Celeribacter neptunius]
MRELLYRLKDRYHLGTPTFQRDDLTFVTVKRDELRAILTELRDVEGFTHLTFLTAVDWIEEGLFQLTYMINNREANQSLGLRVMLTREDEPGATTGDTIHDLWPTAATYQRELNEMFGINFPGSPRVDEEFILEGWTDLPPYRRDFDTLAYSQQTYRERPGRGRSDPKAHMQETLYPDYPKPREAAHAHKEEAK